VTTFIDFFAGIGGFTKGLTKAGMKCAGYCEKDKFALKSYRALHEPNEKEWFSDDITKIKSDEIPYADGWTAGFPCQDISVCGSMAGLDGERSGLFFEIIRLLKGKSTEDKPRWLLLENVKNLLSINEGRDFTEILYQLSEVGYDCEWQVINSKTYVPQNRERVFIVGHIRGQCAGKVFPIGYANEKTPVQIIGGSQGNRVYGTSGMSVTLTAQGGGGGAKSGLYCVGFDNKKGVTGEIDTAYCLMASDYRGLNRRNTHTAVLDENKEGLCFIDLNSSPKITETARCIKSRYDSGISNHKGDNSGVFAGGRIRKLTPLECFRLQGFSDDDYKKTREVNSDTQLYKQIGNGVTVPVIYEIGKKLMEVYNG